MRRSVVAVGSVALGATGSALSRHIMPDGGGWRTALGLTLSVLLVAAWLVAVEVVFRRVR